jgi:hypothetical protein
VLDLGIFRVLEPYPEPERIACRPFYEVVILHIECPKSFASSC